MTGEDERYETNDLHRAAVHPQNGQKRHVEVVDLSGGQSENVEAAIMRALAEADAEIEEVRSVLDTPTQKKDSVSQIPVEKENGAGQDVRTVTGQMQLEKAQEPHEAAETDESTLLRPPKDVVEEQPYLRKKTSQSGMDREMEQPMAPLSPAESTTPIEPLASVEPGVQEEQKHSALDTNSRAAEEDTQIQIDLRKPHAFAAEEISERQGDARGDAAEAAGTSVVQQEADPAVEYDKLAEEGDIEQIVEDLTQQPAEDSGQAENAAAREIVAPASAQPESPAKGLVTISSAADEAPSLHSLASAAAAEQNATLHTVKPGSEAAVEQVSVQLPEADMPQAALDAQPLSAAEEAVSAGALTNVPDAEESAPEHASKAGSSVGSMEPLVGVQQVEPVAATAVSSVAAEPPAHTTLSQPENAASVAAVRPEAVDGMAEASQPAPAMVEATAEAVSAPEAPPKRRRRFQGIPGLNVEGDANDVDVTLFRIDLNI